MKSGRTPFKVMRAETPGPGAYSPKEPQKHVPSVIIHGRQTPDTKRVGPRSSIVANCTPTNVVPVTNSNSSKPAIRNRSSPKSNECEPSKRSSLLQRPSCIGCTQKLGRLESDLQELSSAKVALEAALSAKADELLSVGAAISELRSGNMMLARANDEMAGRISDFAKRCHDAETLLDDERARRQQLANQLVERDRLIDELRSEKQHFVAELRSQQRDAYQSEMDRLTATLAEQECLVQQLRADLLCAQTQRREEAERFATELREHERLAASQKAELDRLREEVRSANESVCVCAAEFERACATADALRKELNENANMIAFYRNAVAQRDAELEAARTQNRSFLDTVANETTRSDEMIDDLRRRISVYEHSASAKPEEGAPQETSMGVDSCPAENQSTRDARLADLSEQNNALLREVASQRTAMLALQTANAELLRRVNERDTTVLELDSRVLRGRKAQREALTTRSDVESAIGSQRSVTDSEYSSTTDNRDESSAENFTERDNRRSVADADSDALTLAFGASVGEKDMFSFSEDAALYTQVTMNATGDPSRVNATDCTAVLLERVETNQCLEELARKYAALSEDFANLRDERETSRSLCEGYRADCARLRTQLDAALSRIAEFQATFNRQADQLDALNVALKASEESRVELERRAVASDTELQRAREELETERARCRAEFDAELARCTNVCESKVDACVRKIEAQNVALCDQLSKIGELIEQLTDAQAEIDALESANERLTAANVGLQREAEALKRRTPSEVENDSLKQKVTELERFLDEAKSERTTIAGILAKKDSELNMLVALSEKLGGELHALKTTNMQLSKQLERTRTELAAMRDERSRLRHTCNELRAQVEPFGNVLRAYALERRALSERTNVNTKVNNSSSPRTAQTSRKASDERANEEINKLTNRYAKMITDEKHRQRFQNVMAISNQRACLEQENERLRNEIANMKLRSRDETKSSSAAETSI